MGEVSLQAVVGDKTYPALVLTDSTPTATFESDYTLTITLKDQNGELVKGATVEVRKGITTIGTCTDNGDGTYTFAGAMGEVSVVAKKDGYSVARKTQITSAAPSFELVMEKDETDPGPGTDPGEGDPGSGDEKDPGGCACGTFGGTAGGTGLGLGLMILAGAGIWALCRSRKRA